MNSPSKASVSRQPQSRLRKALDYPVLLLQQLDQPQLQPFGFGDGGPLDDVPDRTGNVRTIARTELQEVVERAAPSLPDRAVEPSEVLIDRT